MPGLEAVTPSERAINFYTGIAKGIQAFGCPEATWEAVHKAHVATLQAKEVPHGRVGRLARDTFLGMPGRAAHLLAGVAL